MNVAYNEISCADASRMIGIDYTTVTKWCKEGRINCNNISAGTTNGRWVISEDEVEYIKKLKQKFGREYMKKYRKDWRIGQQPVESTDNYEEVVYVEPTNSVATIKSVVTNITTEEHTKANVDIDEIAIKVGYIQDIKNKIEKLELEKQKLMEEYDKLRTEVISAL